MNKKVIGTLLCAAALLLVSCENFLKGQETAEQIQAAITYANSDFTLIKVKPQKGTGNVVKPAGGEALQKPTDVFDLVFEPTSDYEFVTWEVSSKSVTDNQMLLNYIQIDDPNNAETTVTFRRPLEDIIITPVVVRRPKILSYSPMYTGSLSLKDSKIQVIFDRKMDPSSIYYSVDEINELKAELGLRDQDLLPENAVIGTTNIYGYKKDGEYIYKNILIKNNDSQKNINAKFNAPYFESPTTLVITANKNNLPDNYSYISVSLDKSFCYNVEYENMSKKIGLFESKDWVYQVNNQNDDIPPQIMNLEIKKKNKNGQIVDLQIESETLRFSNYTCAQLIEKLDEKKIYLKFTAGDDGSGLVPYFIIELNRFLDNNYYGLFPNNDLITLKTYYTNIGRQSTYEGSIDLSNYPEGLYALNIYLYDNNGTELHGITMIPEGQTDPVEGTVFFTIDDDIYVSPPSIVYGPDYSTSAEILWDPPSDLKSVDIEYTKAGEENWISIDQITGIFSEILRVDNDGNPVLDEEGNKIYDLRVKNSQIIDSLESKNAYDFKVTFTDWYGHTKTFTKTHSTKAIPQPRIMSITYINKNATLTYSFNEAFNGNEKIFFVCSTSENFTSGNYKIPLSATETSETYSYDDLLKNYTYYQIWVEYNDKTQKSQCFRRYDVPGMATITFGPI